MTSTSDTPRTPAPARPRTTPGRLLLAPLAGVAAGLVFYALLSLAGAAFAAISGRPEPAWAQGWSLVVYTVWTGLAGSLLALALGFPLWLVLYLMGLRGWRIHLGLGLIVGLAFTAYALLSGHTEGRPTSLSALVALAFPATVWLTVWRVMYRREGNSVTGKFGDSALITTPRPGD